MSSQIGAESEWRTANTESIKSAAATMNIDLRFADAQQKQENQIKAIRSFIAQKVDVIAFSPVVETGFETVLKEAKVAKIPVILTDRAVNVKDDSLWVSFMGSDFSYADMTERPLDAYRYTLMKELEIEGHPVWQIESVPITEQEQEETGYTKSVVFVRKDNFVVVRSVAWVKKGSRLKYFEVKKLEQIDGIWVATEMVMSTRKGKETLHRTLLSTKNVRFGQKQRDDFFSVRQLEKGP